MAKRGTPDVRSRILDAALDLLAKHGFTELSQLKIAHAAGVRQSHLTYYFPTRTDLLEAVAVRSVQELLASLRAGLISQSIPTADLPLIVGKMLADKRRARVMLGLIVSSDEEREIKRFLRRFVAQVRIGIAGIARLLGHEPSATDVAAFHLLIVGATILNVARDDAASRRECAEIARVAVSRFLVPETQRAGTKRRRRRKAAV